MEVKHILRQLLQDQNSEWQNKQDTCRYSILFEILLLDACVLFSSVTSLIGGGGQANYASANACLDALATCRRAHGCNATSVQWGPWADVGMASSDAVSARMSAGGLGLIDAWQGEAALKASLRPRQPAIFAFWLVRWDITLDSSTGTTHPAMQYSCTSSLPEIRHKRGSPPRLPH